LIDFIIVDVCGGGAQSIKQRVHQILNQRKASVKTIRNVIREYAGTLGDENDDVSEEEQKQREQERLYLLQLVDKFWNKVWLLTIQVIISSLGRF
jgi:beta-catenin-like protein 1